MSLLGHLRHFERAPVTSAVTLKADNRLRRNTDAVGQKSSATARTGIIR